MHHISVPAPFSGSHQNGMPQGMDIDANQADVTAATNIPSQSWWLIPNGRRDLSEKAIPR